MIYKRVAARLRAQDWAAITIELGIVIVGVFIGIPVDDRRVFGHVPLVEAKAGDALLPAPLGEVPHSIGESFTEHRGRISPERGFDLRGDRRRALLPLRRGLPLGPAAALRSQ